jgi:type I restriction enzyme R subunit
VSFQLKKNEYNKKILSSFSLYKFEIMRKEMNKKQLSETDIRTKFITPAIQKAGWDIQRQVREEVTFTDGRIIVRGRLWSRGKRKRADYILYYKSNIPLAIIEAKDNKQSIGSGMQQALEYAEILDIPYVYSTNGDGFLEHNRIKESGDIEIELSLDKFPSPDELWKRYKIDKDFEDDEEKIIAEDYFFEKDGKLPRYYQRVAINRTIEAIAKGEKRIFLVMATGTGKTYTAFQIIYRLWKSKTKRRILFLADRNILIDQTKTNDFKHFSDKMTKITNRKIDKSYEIYLALYQQMTGNDDWKNVFQEFSSDFFDLIIIDECHRGSAREDSSWREVLDYFSSATQIGLTATPKETKEISNIEYFGDPLYIYSLKQGIEDGFLAPYKVIRVTIDRDADGWRPYQGQRDRYGHEIEDREYNLKDYDRNLVLEQRTKVISKCVSDYLKKNNCRYDKSIFFCVDIDHAERMRKALVNENSDIAHKHSKYVMKITGDDKEGKLQLDNFIDPESTYPVFVTTSKLMTTGVDAQTCKYIILDSNINSMTEFKQIIGRGTRIKEDYGKMYFTIIDFRNVTKLFADPDFDGDPVKIKETDQVIPPDIVDEQDFDPNDEEITTEPPVLPLSPEMESDEVRPRKYYVKNVEVNVINERIMYYDNNGNLITESLEDYIKKNVAEHFSSLNDFLNKWNSAEKKKAIVDELQEQGVLLHELQEKVGKDIDPFDLICHVVYDKPPLTRRERANNVKKRDYFTKYGVKAKAVLDSLLDKYADEGIENLEDIKVLKIDPFTKFGGPGEIVKLFGGKKGYFQALIDLETQLYAEES